MSNARKTILPSNERVLFSEVDGICPLCAKPLHFNKKGKLNKSYEIAHIYPLNCTSRELDILKNETILGVDLNDMENLILLCTDCHTKYDKDKTVEEYRKVVAIKERFIQHNKIKDEYHSYKIESEINHLIETLCLEVQSSNFAELEYSALKIDEKADESLNSLTKRSIKHDVLDYYLFIKDIFKEIDSNSSGKFNLIASQVKTFYLNNKLITNNQEQIFRNMIEWMNIKTGNYSEEASRIVVSFFIQNCEVFS